MNFIMQVLNNILITCADEILSLLGWAGMNNIVYKTKTLLTAVETVWWKWLSSLQQTTNMYEHEVASKIGENLNRSYPEWEILI